MAGIKPYRPRYPELPVTEAEHHALRELLVAMLVIAVLFVAIAAAEPLLDVIARMVGL